MFVQYTYIEEAHKPVLESVIRQHAVVTERHLARLYETALSSFKNGGNIAPHPNVSWSYVANESGSTVASATDNETGIYVQLTGQSKDDKLTKLLTVGQKWAMQASVNSSIATKMW